eukprot:361525-Chlamydomonas_euryale.AAC.10
MAQNSTQQPWLIFLFMHAKSMRAGQDMGRGDMLRQRRHLWEGQILQTNEQMAACRCMLAASNMLSGSRLGRHAHVQHGCTSPRSSCLTPHLWFTGGREPCVLAVQSNRIDMIDTRCLATFKVASDIPSSSAAGWKLRAAACGGRIAHGGLMLYALGTSVGTEVALEGQTLQVP